MDNQDLTTERRLKAKDKTIAELLEALESARQTLHNLGQGELHGDAKIIAYNAALNAGRAIRKGE